MQNSSVGQPLPSSNPYDLYQAPTQDQPQYEVGGTSDFEISHAERSGFSQFQIPENTNISSNLDYTQTMNNFNDLSIADPSQSQYNKFNNPAI